MIMDAIHLQPAALQRTLQSQDLQPLHQPHDTQLHHNHPGLQQLPPGLQGPPDQIPPELFQHRFPLTEPPSQHTLHAQNQNLFDHGPLTHLQPQQQGLNSGYAHHGQNTGQFGIIGAPNNHLGGYPQVSRPPPPRISVELAHDAADFGQQPDQEDVPIQNTGQFDGLKLIPNPPRLDWWRERLFNVDDIITLSEEEFQTYFPHIDNVYSHRSTQKHKRKRFVSHYWDCRLKGRPPGTKKSTDPDKKKRKRVARERDLCDVKIKITEYFSGPDYQDQSDQQSPVEALSGNNFFPSLPPNQQTPPWSIPNLQPQIPFSHPPPPEFPGVKKYFTIQRVNGNGGNGKADGIAGPHKHTLEESDRVKKNSVIRWQMKNDKDKKRIQKSYHKKATGNALNTVKNHSKEDDLKLYGSCFCPFVQRVWISLEAKGIPYQYIEVDPYKKPQSLLDVNPRGLVPALRHGPTWSCHESSVLMEYLEDLQTGPPLLPSNPQLRANCRLWSDHINRHIIPAFYRFLQEQDASKQIDFATELKTEIAKLVDAADSDGPFFLGSAMSFVDVQIAPWIIRLNRVLKPYRGWPEPEEGTRWARWVDAIEREESVRNTTSTDELYLDSYERYAENRPNTSQLANAVNSGRGLP